MAWWEATKKPVFSWQQELNWIKQSYTSWFLGEYVTEGCTFIEFPFIILVAQFFCKVFEMWIILTIG
ncbi:hypothetical protein DVH24_020932 [Malus domestica]|uniref:Uncharacterized protein n=1 Tax=Malus domestica TaxID=3750 RepID=A0A498J7Y7_MALDO|nr:hypothetical protein DVH24_020932 [Malus domestica]